MSVFSESHEGQGHPAMSLGTSCNLIGSGPETLMQLQAEAGEEGWGVLVLIIKTIKFVCLTTLQNLRYWAPFSCVSFFFLYTVTRTSL